MTASIRFFMILAVSVVGTVASARPLTTAITCEQASDLVATKHAIILSTGQFTFDRYVDSQGQCELSEQTKPAWVATSDSSSCFIGYTCEQDRRN